MKTVTELSAPRPMALDAGDEAMELVNVNRSPDVVSDEPAPPEPVEEFHESGAELDCLNNHVDGVLDRLERQLPPVAHVSVYRDHAWRRFSDGARRATRRWSCLIYPGGMCGMKDPSFHGEGDTPDAAAEGALAAYQATSRTVDVGVMSDDELIAVVADPAMRPGAGQDETLAAATAELLRRLDAAQRPAA